MKKTLFITKKEANTGGNSLFKAPYIFFGSGKWREDVWYFNDEEQVGKQARELGFKLA